MKFEEYIKDKKIIAGMVHIKALPGTPGSNLTSEDIISHAIDEAKTYIKHGIRVVLIENMYDIPYTKIVGPEIPSLMAIVGKEIKKLGLYCGIQILAGANKEALAAAKAAGLDFIRAEGFVYAHIADEGYIESCAGDLLRYRKQICAENVLLFVDIKKKHSSHSITGDVSIGETAHAAEFFLADGLIVTGISTGKEALVQDVVDVKTSVNIPVMIGSGITNDNLGEYFDYADIFIVGSYVKENGLWSNKLDEERISLLMKEFRKLDKKNG